MGKITKTLQPKHKESNTPWLQEFVQRASTTQLPDLPAVLHSFPTRWPFPRGDLYHWIPLLNKFDTVLESFVAIYKLSDGTQTRDFGSDVILQLDPQDAAPSDTKPFDATYLRNQGYGENADAVLVRAVLQFTEMLLHHCGNRSIYASSSHLNDLLNSTDLDIVCATLRVGVELAKRYQASVKRLRNSSFSVTSALLLNHYNIDLYKVHQLAQPFVKTPIIKPAVEPHSLSTPTASSKGKPPTSKAVNSMYANDLCAIAKETPSDESRWQGWGDVRVPYYPVSSAPEPQEPQPVQQRIELSSTPSTPTPLRRSNSANVVQTTPRSARQSMPDDTPLPGLRSPAFGGTESAGSAQKSVDLPHSAVVTSPIYKLLDRAPSDLPKESRYDFLNRVRVAKALTGNVSSREQALKARLLAIENLAYIHQESAFVDKALKQDSDEPRRFQLIYQLAELIRPSSDGSSSVSRDVQAIALSLLDVLTTNIHSKIPDIFSALNATVNHGVLLYVIRKAVAEMKEDDAGEGYTVEDEWRDNLFSLTHHVTLAMANTSRNTPEIISAGLFDIMVEILAIRSNVAERMYSTLLANLDSLISYVQSPSFSIISAEGLDAITDLITHEVDLARKLVADGKGTPRSWRSQIVDYDVPFWQQQNLKFLLKFIHHLMTNAFAFGGNTDRLLRNLVDKSTLLQSLREIITNGDVFGSLVWTSTANSLSDFLNNDPTSFAAISEAGLVQCFLESITGRPVTVEESAGPGDSNSQDTPSSLIAVDDRPHPPTQEMLQTPRTGTLAGGIRATSEAITAVPTVLNAISLNNQGIKMVASSRAFESYFEIFESPEHVRIMSANDPELAANVGNHFDELARHHPALRPAITNAVVDMVARIVYLSNQKASASGLGAKLVTHDVSASSPADTDANGIEWDSEGSHLRFGPEMSPPQQSALPYIYATASFLQQYVGNQQLRQSLVQKGLIEYLLDLCTSPSLPHRFGESGAARSLHQVIAQLVETSPVLGIPSLVRRIRKSLEALEPLTTSSTSESFFVRYLAADPAKTDSAVSLSTGNVVVKELLNVQSLVKALANCFPISNRSANLMYPTVNAYDYYHELITALGPLLRSVVTQEELAMRCVPWSWIQPKKQQESTDGATGTGDGSSNSAGDDEAALSSMLSPNQYRMAWDRLRPSTKTEYSSSRYRNFDTINAVLHSSMSAIFPLLQTFGKALLSRSRNDRTSSDRDNYIRAHHVKLAHELGGILYDQLTIPENPRTPAQFHYWIIMTHATHEVLFDRRYDPRAERNGHQASASVLVAFMQKGGFKQLNSILEIFASEINDPNTGEDSPLRKLATIGVKKILKLYAIVANGKTIAEAVGHTAFLGRSSSRSLENQIAPNLVVELRMTLLPVIQDLWKSPLIENEAKDSEEIANKVIDILKSISGVDGTEHGAYGRSEKNTPPLLLKQEEVKFPWTTVVESISRVRGEGYDGQLASEAVFRANGDAIRAIDYCKAHKAGIAGARNPIPEVDVMNTDPDEIESTSTPTGEPQPATSASDDQPMIDADLPADLPAGILDNEILGDLRDVAPLVPGMEWTEGNATSSTAQDAAPISADSETRSQTGVPREELDEARVKLREDLIDRCLDVIRAHPSSTYEISELINNSVIRSSTDDSAKQEIGETLVNALISFVADEDLKPNGRSISAYAHLLSLLLQNRGFFTATMGSLRDNVTEFLGFLRPASPATEEIDPWIPYILLIFEILLSDDEQPSDIKWKAPTSEDDVIEPLQWAPKDLIVNESDRQALLTSILDILPRVNKAESLAVSVLRILVILTRNKSTAQVVGDKKNLSRIFVMMKQLSSSGSNRLGDTRISSYVLTILRHIIEDEDIIKQLMRSEIRSYFDNVRSQRNPDIGTYLRQNSHVALRDPHLFVDVSNEMVCISRWNAGDSTSQRQTVALKAQKPETPKDDVAPTVRATEDLSIQDVKPSTESTVKPTTDAIKSVLQDIKRPILENPDGVIHFLLCELLNYREVEDKEPVQPAADSKDIKDTASPNPNSVNDSSDNKDKKKPSFKAEEHPIFIYRCLILRCLIELLQSYNQTKVEFINFKRSAPMQTNTPIKPRSSVLNYLLTDLLCATPLDGSSDTLADKKKAATSIQAQNLLVALMAKTSEKPVDRTREKFDYDEETDLLFVRKFVLDTILKAYKDASSSNEAFDIRYGRMLALADVMHQIMGADKDGKVLPSSRHHPEPMPERSHAQIRRLMYEKGYLNTLTSSIADIDLAFPPVKKTIKQILKVLRVLTSTATHLSNANILPDSSTTQEVEDDIASATSLSDLEDDREETPDLYRNSALGMLEPGRDPDDDYESGSGEDDEEMYDDEYGEEMEYDEDVSLDGENDVSDEDEDVEGMEGMEGMGHIEGLPGELGVVEVTMEDDDDEDDDEMDEDDEDMSEDDEELGSDEMDEMGDQIEIVDDEGNPVEDDGASGWESDTDDEGEVDEDDEHDLHDYEAAAQEMIEQGHQHELGAFGGLIPALDEEDDYDGGDDVNIHPYPEEDEDDDDDDDEDEDDMDEDDYAFEPYLDDGPPPHILSSSMGWDVFEDGLGGGHNHRHRHGFRGPFPPIPLMMGGPRDPLLAGAMRNTFMRPGRNDRSGTNDDGLNPLLRRVNEPGRDGPSRPHGSLARILRGHGGSPLALINELITNQLPALGGGGPPLQFHISAAGSNGEIQEITVPITHSRDPIAETRHGNQDPSQASTFSTENTISRWHEEAKMVFGQNHAEKIVKLLPALLYYLVPPAIQRDKEQKAKDAEIKRKQEEERKKREEEDRQAREAKEAEDKAAREKVEAEERERAEAEAAARAAANPTSAEGAKHDDDVDAMEGVESNDQPTTPSQQTADQPRVTTIIRGEEVDVTDLGIDADYLEALPEEFREEVIAQAVTQRRSQARETPRRAGEQPEVFQEFLDALPEDIRQEIVQQERAEQRRRDREEARRQQAAAAGQGPVAQEMDTASILMSFPPDLREQVLLDQGPDLMDSLPPEMAAEARRLVRHNPAVVHRHRDGVGSGQAAASGQPSGSVNLNIRPERKTVVQMLDKSGVATLLRLMFINIKSGTMENPLKHVIKDICQNKQTRLDVVSTLLQILQDGTTDLEAVERSFTQLSIKAKQSSKDKEGKTPQSHLKRSLTNTTTNANPTITNSETSPVLIIQQCLDLLCFLADEDVHIPALFLTEHDTVASSLKRSLSRKGKGKVPDLKSHKYAINSLLALLDRDLVIESSTIMDSLSQLLGRVTLPLLGLDRKLKEADETIKKLDKEIEEGEAVVAKAAKSEVGSETSQPATLEQTDIGAETTTATLGATTDAHATAEPITPGKAAESVAKAKEKRDALQKRIKTYVPPQIPVHNLKLVINIFVARECSSKTFKETLSAIKNLSVIPDAMDVFGEELARQSRLLSEKIVVHLDELLPHIEKASTGTEIQGVALAKFSPGAADQNKLLRILTALDHLFSSKKSDFTSGSGPSNETKFDLLATLYRSPTFHALWERLSSCLSAIRQRESLISVATILLPLIETLMVVCKDTANPEPVATQQVSIASPAPESPMTNLFLNFTEEHRRILNELVRNNPSLMKGTFQNLVKNPKVLEFDNKRNWFNRSVHNRNQIRDGRTFPSLQLSVRRDQVFHDSFRSLYFKSGDEMKFGKLNIRFHGEEGVDAGGVTREWFQVLSRQMFDANYALFVPVSSDRTTFHPNKLSGINDEHLMFFKFIGRVIGKALYEGRVLDCYFSRAVYKRILGKTVSVKDMESFDPDYYKSLVWMLENDITDIITEMFSVETDEFGVTRTEDLCENGRNIPVTEDNKQDYVRLVVEHKLLSSVKEQMEHFLKGFHEIIPAELVSIFTEQELELLISGLPDIDVDDWKSNTEYQNYTPSSQQIQWFWRAIRSFDKEELAKLLQFVTGTSKVPLNGFKELEGMNGVNRFNIHRDYGNKDRLPSSHTCFNQLDLPEYESYETLRAQVLKAITAGSDYFGFA